jgi:hypothetical protein
MIYRHPVIAWVAAAKIFCDVESDQKKLRSEKKGYVLLAKSPIPETAI